MEVDPAWKANRKRPLVTGELLGKATIPDAPFENRDGTPYKMDTDYLGEKRDANNPAPGPFRLTGKNKIHLQVWPKGPLNPTI
jgi:alpha-N-arabinofuranosidase